MNNDVILNTNQYPGAMMYAKLHNISFKQLVESFLMKFQLPSEMEAVAETEDSLGSIDVTLMRRTFDAVNQDYLAGRCIPNSQILDYIKSELEWK